MTKGRWARTRGPNLPPVLRRECQQASLPAVEPQSGTFLADPLDVPTKVVAYLADQLGMADASCAKGTWSGKTRFEHQWLIAAEY